MRGARVHYDGMRGGGRGEGGEALEQSVDARQGAACVRRGASYQAVDGGCVAHGERGRGGRARCGGRGGRGRGRGRAVGAARPAHRQVDAAPRIRQQLLRTHQFFWNRQTYAKLYCSLH